MLLDTIRGAPMPMSNDCVNTMSTQGRNLTPKPFIESAKKVLGYIDLDPCGDLISNMDINANQLGTLENDGFAQDYVADTVWVNAPGKSVTGGTTAERKYWLKELKKEAKYRGERPDNVRVISASKWYSKFFQLYMSGKVKTVLGLVYRGGSIGSLGQDLLSEATLCITCGGVKSKHINGSGRIAFETVEHGKRVRQPSNTQSSTFFLLTMDPRIARKFKVEFSQYGVIK